MVSFHQACGTGVGVGVREGSAVAVGGTGVRVRVGEGIVVAVGRKGVALAGKSVGSKGVAVGVDGVWEIPVKVQAARENTSKTTSLFFIGSTLSCMPGIYPRWETIVNPGIGRTQPDQDIRVDISIQIPSLKINKVI